MEALEEDLRLRLLHPSTGLKVRANKKHTYRLSSLLQQAAQALIQGTLLLQSDLSTSQNDRILNPGLLRPRYVSRSREPLSNSILSVLGKSHAKIKITLLQCWQSSGGFPELLLCDHDIVVLVWVQKAGEEMNVIFHSLWAVTYYLGSSLEAQLKQPGNGVAEFSNRKSSHNPSHPAAPYPLMPSVSVLVLTGSLLWGGFSC